jgi:hypothetical protein
MRSKQFVTEKLDRAYNAMLMLEQDLEAGRLSQRDINETISRLKLIQDNIISAMNRIQLEQEQF